MVEKLLVVCVAFLTLSVGRTSGTDCLNVTMFNFFCQLDGQCLGVNSTNTSLELICNGVDDCTFGSDEGGVLNSALMCNLNNPALGPFYECGQGGVRVSIDQLCDGNATCPGPDFDDELNPFCADKCLPPFHGGCTNRECINQDNRRSCGNCFEGYYQNPASICAENPTIIQWEATAYTVLESNTTVEACLNLIVETRVSADITDTLGTQVVTVTVSTMDNTAMDGQDFMFSTQNVVFTNSTRRNCLIVNITGTPGAVTTNLNFSLVLSNPVPAASTTLLADATQIIIQDLDFPSFRSGQSITANEDSGVLQLCVIAVQEIRAPFPITFTLVMEPVPIWPINFIDSSINTSVDVSTIAAGESLCFNVTITDDSFVEQNEIYSFGVTSPSIIVMESRNISRLIIEENDVYTVTLRVGNGSTTIMPEGTNITVEVVLTGQLAPALTVAVNVSTIPDTADITDYTVPAMTQELVFSSNMRIAVQIQQISISLVADRLLEGNETFTVSLSNETLRFTIQDIDVGEVSVYKALFTSTMNIGPQIMENNVTVTVMLNLGTQYPLLYQLNWIDGTVINFNFSSNTAPSTVSQIISLASDGYVDGVLNVTQPLTLSTSIPGLMVTNEISLNIIMYDPDVIYVTFNQSVLSFIESDSSQYIPFSYTGSIGGPFTNYSMSGLMSQSFEATFSNGTANVPSDVTGMNQIFSFLNGGALVGGTNVTFTIVQDLLVEYNETFSIDISTRDTFLFLSHDQLDVIILSDDVLVISFQTTSSVVVEGAGPVQVSITVDPFLTAIPIDLIITTVPITASVGEDFENRTSTQITVLPCMSASYFVNYTIVDDNALELDESFQLLLMASPTDSQFTTAGGNHTVVIRDDVTDGEVSLTTTNTDGVSGMFFNESTMPGNLSFALMVQNLAIPITFTITPSDGTAVQGQDYMLFSFNITFSPGALVQYQAVDILDDNFTEAVEYFSLGIAAADAGVTVVNGGTVQLFISVDEISVTSFMPQPNSVVEGTTLVIPILVSGRFESLSILQDIVSITSIDDTAMLNVDYMVSPVTNFTMAGNSSVTVSALQDLVIEGAESFTLSLNLSDTSFLRLKYSSSVIVAIQNENFPVNATLGFNSSANFTFLESAGTVDFSVTLGLIGAVLDTNLTLNVVVSNGTALEGVHFEVISSSVTFGPAGLTQFIYITLIAEKSVTANRQFSVGLMPADMFVSIVGGSMVNVEIINVDDPCVLSPCDMNANCTRVGTSNFTCTCLPGYSGNGFSCTDINECQMMTDDCSVYATCNNTEGSFQCTCNTGFQGDGVNCIDLNECDMLGTTCGMDATCNNTIGSFVCVCNQGLVGDGLNCIAPPNGVVITARPSTIVNFRDNVTLYCSAQAANESMFQWELNGQALMDQTQATLQLISVNITGTGEYTCVVSNAAGSSSTNITLYVQPYFEDNPQRIMATTGDLVMLVCIARGFPIPSIEWIRDGNTSSVLSIGNSYIVMVSFSSFGNYSCIARSMVNEMNFTVISEPRLLAVSPSGSIFIIPSGSASVEQGNNQTFTCAAQGGPNNAFSWKRLSDGGMVANMSVLTLSFIKASDGGVYRCVVSNKAGSGNADIILNVGPVIEIPPSSVSVLNSLNVTLSCTASGFPLPTISWSLVGGMEATGNIQTTSMDNFITSILTIVVTESNDTGMYICNASSPGFQTVSSAPVALLVQDLDVCDPLSRCDVNANCTSVPGTPNFTCTCLPGYSGNGLSCTDINECQMIIDDCSVYATCNNTEGSFQCTCNTGFQGDGVNCTDINECEMSILNNCDLNAICNNTIGSFNCTCDAGFIGDGIMCSGVMFGDDPHFSVVLPSRKILCFSVMGQHNLSYNLITNPKLLMNAIFSPDSKRDEVTWIGTLGIIAKNMTTKSTQAKLKFEANPPMIEINNQTRLYPKNIERIIIKNSQVSISEAALSLKFKYPSILVVLEDAGLKFTIKFMREHLDMFWHSTAQQHRDSHGLIGQFFREGVEIDEVRKILLMPNKEPVPVMRRPVWAFMEREEKDYQLCWTAMNPGYQGEGLIDGKQSNYLIGDILEDKFTYEDIL